MAEVRGELGLTQRQLAVELGCDPAVISRWERGKAFPRMKSLARLAALSGRPVDWFVGGLSGGTDDPTLRKSACAEVAE